MIRTARIKEVVVPMNRNNFDFRIQTLGTSVCLENTEEAPSERTVQHCSVHTVNRNMYHVAKKST